MVIISVLTAHTDPQLKPSHARTNEVAPIIIHNCKEEFQRVTEFKEPIVYDRIATGLPEHPLLQVRSRYKSNFELIGSS